jgi:Na+-translocating ferredoxin:NAD+ oxidoreductase RnfE subunit
MLAAWAGPYGFTENFRKVILSDCILVERAKATEANEKVTEKVLDALAHTNDVYIAYLTAALDARVAYEKAIREQVGA